jgi:accessory Sec system glycosyltransferase GtfB
VLGLFNDYDDATRELMHSLETAGVPLTPVVINYGGELPDGALCPFVVYTGLELRGEPLFFNEVPIPPWCEIRQGSEVYGEVLRDDEVIGRINYEANTFRQVESVDWLLRDGSVGHTDRYDRYGNRYAVSYYADGVAHQTVYRGPGEWTIEVDHVVRSVVMRSAGSLLTFPSLTDFVSHFVDEQGLADDEVLINSLSYPLFVMRTRARRPNTTLFWQEPMPGDPPENMATELQQPKALARIVFFDERLRRKVAAQCPETPLHLEYLSHLDQFAAHESFDPKRVFTLTNSDDLAGLPELLEAFPDLTFSVAALTLMSERLHELGGRHSNLVLTPSITHHRIRDELEKASVYLDINAGGHVLDVVKAAYYLDLVVMALAGRAKAPDFSLTFATPSELRARLDAATGSSEGRKAALAALHEQHGLLSSVDDYRRLLG